MEMGGDKKKRSRANYRWEEAGFEFQVPVNRQDLTRKGKSHHFQAFGRPYLPTATKQDDVGRCLALFFCATALRDRWTSGLGLFEECMRAMI